MSVFAGVHADGHARCVVPPFLELLTYVSCTLGGESHPVGECQALRASVDSGFGVTGLGLGCDSTNFHEAKAQVVPDREEFAVFVQSGGKTNSVGEDEIVPFEGVVNGRWA